jgi:hypothetical protein
MGSRSCLKNINCPCALRRLVEVHRGSRTSKIRFSDKFGGPKKGRKRNRDPLRLQFICSSFPEAPSVAGEAASSSSSNAADATSPIVAGGQARARMTTRRRCHRRQSARGGRGLSPTVHTHIGYPFSHLGHAQQQRRPPKHPVSNSQSKKGRFLPSLSCWAPGTGRCCAGQAANSELGAGQAVWPDDLGTGTAARTPLGR